MAAKFPRLDFIRNPETRQFRWRLHSTNGLQLSKSSETYARLGGATRCACASLGLASEPTTDGVYPRIGCQHLPVESLDAETGVQVRFLLKGLQPKLEEKSDA